MVDWWWRENLTCATDIREPRRRGRICLDAWLTGHEDWLLVVGEGGDIGGTSLSRDGGHTWRLVGPDRFHTLDPFAVVASSGGTTRAAGATLVVAPPPDFGLAASPATRSVVAGAGTSYTVSTSALNGWTGPAGLSVSGLPASVGSAVLTPATLPGAGTSTLSVATSPSAPAGTHVLTVTGTSGPLSHSTQVSLLVFRPDFTLAVDPAAVTVRRGRSATYAVTVNGTGGFAGSVRLSVPGAPGSPVVSWSQQPVVVPGTVTLTVRTTSSTVRRTYTLLVTGRSGVLRHQVPVSLTVT